VRHRKPGTAQDKRKDRRYVGRVRLAIVPDRSAKSLCGFVENAVAPGSLTVTDYRSGYANLRKRGYDHHAIAECGDPEVAEDFLPIIHLVFANLKTWLTPEGGASRWWELSYCRAPLDSLFDVYGHSCGECAGRVAARSGDRRSSCFICRSRRSGVVGG
jgi:hypothetical protein